MTLAKEYSLSALIFEIELPINANLFPSIFYTYETNYFFIQL